MNLYQTRLAAGLCVRCGKREPETGRKKCAVCAPKEQRTKCKSCGTEVMVPVKPGPRPKVLCEACKSKTEQEICKGCGEPFSYNRSRGKRIYCSAKCGSKARQRFKISTEALLQAQDYECPICEEPVSLSSDIDHDHETGEIRD